MTARVLYIVRPASGGMAGHIRALCAGIGPSSYAVTLASPTVYPDLAAEIQQITLPVADRLSPWADMQVIARLRQLLKSGLYGLVHAHGLKAALLTSLACRQAGSPPLVITLHNSLPRQHIGHAGAMQERLLRWFLQPSARVVVVSQAQANDITARNLIAADRVTTIPNGIDVSAINSALEQDRYVIRASLGLPANAHVVLLVCRIIAAKGIGELLTAAGALCRNGNYRFLIAGDGPDLERFQAATAAAGLENQVIFLGRRCDVPLLLHACDIFVLPSWSEGLPLTVLEAMAAGKPVVATNTGGIPEVVVNGVTGILVAPHEPQALANAINHLAVNPQLCSTMGHSGRHRVYACYTKERMVQRLMDEYAILLGTETADRSALSHNQRL